MSIWRSALRPRVKPLVYRFRNRVLYRLATFYVNSVDNDNDCDFDTNGEAHFARTHLAKASVAFDVGAAKGLWTAIALDANPRLTVHCFEPTSRRFAVLRDRKFGDRVVLNNIALGERAGEAEIFYGASGGSSSLFPQRFAGESYAPSDVEIVKIVTIDDYCSEKGLRRVDFIKMDIEGYEMAAIRGAAGMLRAGAIGVIQFEYGQVFLDAGTSLMRLMQCVHEINPSYKFHKIYPDGSRQIASYTHTLDNFKTQNWAIVHSAES